MKSIKKIIAKFSLPCVQLLSLCVILVAAIAVMFAFLAAGGYFSARTDGIPVDVSGEDSSTGAGDTNGKNYPFNIGGISLLKYNDNVSVIPDLDLKSGYATLVDVSGGEIIESRNSDKRIFPASLTKVMTMIVVVEHLETEESLNDKIIVSEKVFKDMTDAGSSGIGIADGEIMSVQSLLYIMMLNSDGIAATELAIYTAGSTDKFVTMMNEKAESMGLKNTKFMNCTGLHDNDHYTTCRDMATIMTYAVNNPFCYKLMTTSNYTAPVHSTQKNLDFNYFPSHMLLNKYMKLVANPQPGNAMVTGGKTGYTPEAKYCLATCAEGNNGKRYVVITAEAASYVECIEDYKMIYGRYLK